MTEAKQKRAQLENDRRKQYGDTGQKLINSLQSVASIQRQYQGNLETGQSFGSINSKIGLQNLATSSNNQSQQFQNFNVFNQSEIRNHSQELTEQEINFIQNQLTQAKILNLANRFKNERRTLNTTIKKYDFMRIVEEEFTQQDIERQYMIKPSQNLLEQLFKRFRKYKYSSNGKEIEQQQDMEILDFLIALNLLARIIYDKKLELMFKLCDDDDDGCMKPAEVLKMLQKVQRIFAYECSKVDINSSILINQIADQKAESNFHFLMSKIRDMKIQVLKKKYNKIYGIEEQPKKLSDDKEEKGISSKDSKIMQLVNQELDQDDLVDYDEFMEVIQLTELRDNLYRQILPRTLSFKDILSKKEEEEQVYRISDTQVDDFAMFRYELNSIFRKHLYKDEKYDDSRPGGCHPLSRVQGKQLKDLNNEERKQHLDMYRPPGIIKTKPTSLGVSLGVKPIFFEDKLILNAEPTSKLFQREKEYIIEPKQQKKGDDKHDKQFEIKKEKNREQQILTEKKIKEMLQINLGTVDANTFDYKLKYQGNLPPSAKELEEYVATFKDKDTTKDKNIEQYIKKAEDKQGKVRNILPNNEIMIRLLRLEEDPAAEEKRKKINNTMNGPILNQQKLNDEVEMRELKKRKVPNLVLMQGVANYLSVKFTQSYNVQSYLNCQYASKSQHKEKEEDDQDDTNQQEQIVQPQRRNRMEQRIRNRRRNQQESDDEDDNEEEHKRTAADELEEALNDPNRKLTKKELHKLQKRQEKEKIQEARRQQRELEEQKRAEREQKEEEKNEKMQEEQRIQEEEERKKKEEAEQKEQQEYNQWKDLITIEEEGDNQENDSEYENKLQQFIEFIEIRKVVLLEDLAAEFNIMTKDVVDRINKLKESKRLHGIVDDRGKYIHITQDEYKKVAEYIKKKGRVSRADLLMECNKLIRLHPKNEDKEKINKEQKALLDKVQQEYVKADDEN